ncbi:hypothetical protein FTX61_10075 [Nitriliruptoraceae bacterium ZYF776]|nr:hypothetical protein [Profundirhabdus halotolerans]
MRPAIRSATAARPGRVSRRPVPRGRRPMARTKAVRTERGRAGRKAAAKANRPWWKRWWLGLLVVPALGLAAVGLLLFFLVFSSVPLPDDIAATSSTVLDRDGEEIGGLAAGAAREDVPLAELPDVVPDAVMAAEDRGFYDHNGISVTGIARALFTNVRSGNVEQGGSTITQQYIKNAAVGAEQTYTRKVQEAALAIKLERAYEKDEILGFYLNTIYWGRGTYGIQAAAQTFFDVDARELDLNQAATLAGIIASPGNYDPLDSPDLAERRRRYVLDGMLATGAIDQATHDATVEAGLPEVTERTTVESGPNAYYLNAVERELATVDGFEDGALYRGLRIHTGLNQRMQRVAQETLAEAVGTTDSAALTTVAPRTGEVLALVGGPDFDTQQLNVAVTQPRAVGSTFKAFTLQAFVAAGNSPDSRFPAPGTLDTGEDDYTVRNFGETSFGEQSVLQATASSTNTVYYQMQEEVGREAVIEAAGDAGLPTDKAYEPLPTSQDSRGGGATLQPVPSLTLGPDGFTTLEMASAYGTYANEGVHVTPHLVTRIEDADGNVVWEPDLVEEQSVDQNVARAVTQGLVGVVQSGSGQAADLGRPTAGKTGTTSNSRDVWFVGYVPQVATALWMGNLDNSEIEGEATGGGLAAPVWAEYMRVAVETLEVQEFTPPDLSGFDAINDEPESCPSGYRFADPPTEADEDGFFPDVLTDITDDQGRPCVEVAPEPEEDEPECPAGYAFADPPGAGADPQPDVRDDITDAQGRPCVETDPEPEPVEEPPPPDDEPTDDGTEPVEPPAPPPPPPPDDDDPVDPPTDDGAADGGADDGDADGTVDGEAAA